MIDSWSNEAEMAVIGSALISGRAARETRALLADSDFYIASHQTVWGAICHILARGAEADLVTLRDELVLRGKFAEAGGEEYLVQLAECVPSPANSEHYAAIVKRHARLRAAARLGRRLQSLGADDEPEEVVRRGLDALVSGPSAHASTTQADMAALMADLDACVAGREEMGVPTGLEALDAYLGRLRPGCVYVIGARSSVGKTALALGIAEFAAARAPVLYASLEMTRLDLTRRRVLRSGRVHASALRVRDLARLHYQTVASACDDLYEHKLYVDDGAQQSPVSIRAEAERIEGLGLVVVDYLQLLRGAAGAKGAENFNRQVSDWMVELHALARDLDVPVIALSQLNREVEKRDGKRPTLADLRDSGSIESEAEAVVLIYRRDYYKTQTENLPAACQISELLVRKNRNGPTGTAYVEFRPQAMSFETADGGQVWEYRKEEGLG